MGLPARGEIGVRRRIDGLQELAAPAELDAIGGGLDDGALHQIAHADEPGHALGAGLPEELRLGRRLDDAPVVVDDDPVGELVGLGQIVGHEDRGDAPVAQGPLQVVAELAAQRRVEGRERLVEQEQLRIHGERAPEGDALLLAPGQLARRAVLQPAQLEPRDDLGRPPPLLRCAGARAARRRCSGPTVRWGNRA